MYERLEPEGYTWKEVSKRAKDFYFEEFKKWVVWKQPDNMIYAAWLKSAAVRYKDLHSRARQQWESKSGLNNRIGMEVWQSWIEKWKTPEFQTKSKTKRKNRRGGAEVGEYPATHTGGSASHRTHASRLAADLHKNLDAPTLFELMHTKKHDRNTYIDKKSAEIAKNLKTLRAEQSQPVDGSSEPQPTDGNKLYYQAVGGPNKRNKIYGLGSSQDIFYEPTSSTIAHLSSVQPNSQDYHKLETELEEMKERIKEMDEVKQRMREMESQIAKMLQCQNQNQ